MRRVNGKSHLPTHVLRVFMTTGGAGLREYFFHGEKGALEAFNKLGDHMNGELKPDHGPNDLIKSVTFDSLSGLKQIVHANGISIVELAALKDVLKLAQWTFAWDQNKPLPKIDKVPTHMLKIFTMGGSMARDYFFATRAASEAVQEDVASSLKGAIGAATKAAQGRASVVPVKTVRFDTLGGQKVILNTDPIAAIESASLKEVDRQAKWLAAWQQGNAA